MSQYGLIYRMEFKNVEGNTIRINISPTDNLIPDIDTPEIIELKGGDHPLIISASNNDEDKYTPIRSKSAQIKFRTDMSAGLDSSTFSQGGDDLWRVDIYLQDTTVPIFHGFLMMADNQQPFQPDPQYVTLTATDHLAALKEIKLTDLDGDTPIGKYRVADLITFCLRKTGLVLQLQVVNNLHAGSGELTMNALFAAAGDTITVPSTRGFYIGQVITISGTASNNIVTSVTAKTPTVLTVAGALNNELSNATFTDYVSGFHWYDIVEIDAKTFESEIGECEDCYTVLSKILGEGCYITQWAGAWWIMRVDEMEGNTNYVAHFNQDGVYDTTIPVASQFIKSIGFVETFKFANADTLLRFVRPHGFVKETFNFTAPLEVPCNIDFSRGALLVDSGSSKTYDLDCWTKRRGLPGAYNVPITITAFIERLFNDNDYETDRYVVITPQTGHVGFSSTDDEYIESEGIPVNQFDKLTADIDWRFDNDIASSSANLRLFRVVLVGDDGSGWILGEDTPGSGIYKWFDTAGWTSNTGEGVVPVIFGDQDETEWQHIGWAAPPVPVAGTIYLWANQAYTNAAVPSGTNVSYANLRFEYIPLINGTYSKYSGQYSRVDRTATGYFANRDEEVFISDSPTKIYKGAMFTFLNGAYVLLQNWYNAAPFGNLFPPSVDYIHPYGYIQAFDVWNQYKGYNDPDNGRGIGINIFAGSVKGLGQEWPDLINKYILSDANRQTNDRYFMLISFSQDWKTCIWTGVFIEVYNTVIGKSYDDPFTFEYIAS